MHLSWAKKYTHAKAKNKRSKILWIVAKQNIVFNVFAIIVIRPVQSHVHISAGLLHSQ